VPASVACWHFEVEHTGLPGLGLFAASVGSLALQLLVVAAVAAVELPQHLLFVSPALFSNP
jgi:hypothetical protein